MAAAHPAPPIVIILHSSAGVGDLVPLIPVLVAAVAYGLGVTRLTTRGDRWSRWRTASFAAGVVVLAVALLPPLATRADHFPVHVGQHLLISGVAPLLLVLGRPVTLAVRVLPVPGRRRLLTVLHSRPVAVLISPAVVIALVVAPLYAYYLTGWFAYAGGHPVWHPLTHAHMLAAGVLSTSYLLAVEPLARRAGVVERLLVLVLIAGSHDALAKLMYGLGRPLGGGTLAEIERGAQWMYYGGDAITVALAVSILAGWYARGGRELRRTHRRSPLGHESGARQRHQLQAGQGALLDGQHP